MTSAARIAVAALALIVCQAIQAAPIEGKDYVAINPQQPTSDASKILVTEYFNHQCPHCFAFARPFAAWSGKLPADVRAERVAVSIGHSSWEPMARAFYALEAMKATAKVDEALFTAIHRRRANLTTEESIADWLGKHGVNRPEFTKFYGSFSVQVKTKRAVELSRAHRIPSVPALVIDGRYMVTIADDGNFNDQLKVADHLVEKVRRERVSRKNSGG